MTDKDYLKKVGRRIALLRKQKGLSQLDVCAIINMDKPNLSSIENGRQNFTTLTLKKIADALEVDVFEFFNLKD
ncbi:MAG: helix-turn-helix transcriptional regulator [Flavobacteriaceae bacterium]|nr:helix-turn-helix transcriptional regulator [Flavobacteriaceae bacterium]